MKLNCKEGDLAIVVRSVNGLNYGKIVTCLKLHPEFKNHENVWEVDRNLTWRARTTGRLFELNMVCDANLKPINPDDSEDEILRIAGKPVSVQKELDTVE